MVFNETGLPGGSIWTVRLDKAEYSSTYSSITYTEPNGSYSYSIGSVQGFGPNPSNGTLLVKGSPFFVAVSFARVYEITFTDGALPRGTNWSVTLTGVASSVILTAPEAGGPSSLTRWSDDGSVIQFYLSNGNYSYSAYAPSYSTIEGTLEVHGPGTVALAFSTGSPASSTLPILDYAGIGVVVVAAAVVVALVFIRPRRNGPNVSKTSVKPSEEEDLGTSP